MIAESVEIQATDASWGVTWFAEDKQEMEEQDSHLSDAQQCATSVELLLGRRRRRVVSRLLARQAGPVQLLLVLPSAPFRAQVLLLPLRG